MPNRRMATEIYREVLAAIDPGEHLRRHLRVADGVLHLDGEEPLSVNLRPFSRVLLLAVGKAATPMAEAVAACLAPALEPRQTLGGLVIGGSLPVALDARLEFRLGSHPTPDRQTPEAARAALRLMDAADPETLVLVLISGGASAMMDLPLDPALPMEAMFAFHAALVRSGISIVEMNTLRKHFSAVKGGRLAARARGAALCTLLISDVPLGAADAVGSGPTLPDSSTVTDCQRLLEAYGDTLALPPAVEQFFASPDLAETPKAGDPAFARSEVRTVLSSRELSAAAARVVQRRGWRAVIDMTCEEWDYRDAAEYLLGRLAALRRAGPVCLISGGEISVRVPAEAGSGGRNQQFALECARRLAESGFRATVLSAGTDGIDGQSPAAGGVADETTFARARAMGLDAAAAVARFDSYPLLQALGDALLTGPSGNNVRDLRLLIAD